MTTYYKFLRNGGYGTHAPDYRWNLPTDGQPAAWEPKIEGRLIPCENGYHVFALDHWATWASDELYEVETRGELLDHGEKLVTREARLIGRLDGWNERNIRLFAADCAEHVLPIWEHIYPDDARPRRAIKAARDYAHGKIVGSILHAARAAAGAAAGDAAGAAARDAAGDAAGAAAWDAAGAAERSWQRAKLREYLGVEE